MNYGDYRDGGDYPSKIDRHVNGEHSVEGRLLGFHGLLLQRLRVEVVRSWYVSAVLCGVG